MCLLRSEKFTIIERSVISVNIQRSLLLLKIIIGLEIV